MLPDRRPRACWKIESRPLGRHIAMDTPGNKAIMPLFLGVNLTGIVFVAAPSERATSGR